MAYYNKEIIPSQDTGWGLIYRVNDLLKDIETLAVKGMYDEWNFKLDRIWANLCYRETVIVEKEGNKITEMKLPESDFKEKEFLDNKISEAKKNMRIARKEAGINWSGNSEYLKWKNQLYKNLLIKDVWVRKKMYEQKLYIKELKHSPAGAMWGR